jgi:hypothetical protein
MTTNHNITYTRAEILKARENLERRANTYRASYLETGKAFDANEYNVALKRIAELNGYLTMDNSAMQSITI